MLITSLVLLAVFAIVLCIYFAHKAHNWKMIYTNLYKTALREQRELRAEFDGTRTLNNKKMRTA